MSSFNQKPGIPKYRNDGKGRDTYISFSNGGFSNYPYSRSYRQDFYEINIRRNHPDLYKRRPIIKYNMDGKGRDYFIHQNILSEHCKLKDNEDFPHILRNGIEINPNYFNKSYRRSKFEKNLINRIFYGKCQGVKDRLMQPKVKFNKKGKVLKYNLTSPGFAENKNAEDILNNNNTDMTNMNRINNGNFITNLDASSNNNKKKSMSMNKKRKYLIKKFSEGSEADLFKGIKSLYLFNHKRNWFKETGLPLLD
jgi:hypothetical protein